MIGSRGGAKTVRVTRYRDGAATRKRDALAVEEPMEIRLSWLEGGVRRTEPLAVTMRTPGHDFELAAGFLHGEGVVASAEDLVELTYCTGPEEQEYNVVEARLASGRAFDPESVKRNFYATSSCGVCGKASLDAVGAQGCAVLPMDTVVDSERVVALPDRLREEQGVFSRTGGLHAAGLFAPEGPSAVVFEDVGRHNAVDKVIGRALLDRKLPASDRVLVVSGRASFEVVQKSIAAGIPVLVAVGAPSSLAVELAVRFRQTLIGFARDGGFNVYSVPERVV
jgi:FdhD protein